MLDDIEFNCPDCLQIERECYNCRRALSSTSVGASSSNVHSAGLPSFKMDDDGNLIPMNEAAKNFDYEADGYESWDEFVEHMQGVMHAEGIGPAKSKKPKKKSNPLSEFDLDKAMDELTTELGKELPLDFAKYKVDPIEREAPEIKQAPAPKKPRKPRKPKSGEDK